MSETLAASIRQLRRLAQKILEGPFYKGRAALEAVLEPAMGVYLVRHRSRGFIYVGMTQNLRSRILQHLAREGRSPNMSQFRLCLMRNDLCPRDGVEMTNWILRQCEFSFVVTPDRDTANLLEMFLVHLLKAQGNPLMNTGKRPKHSVSSVESVV